MKIIIDTNILIDAMQDDFSYTWKILDLVLQGKVQAVASEKILKENRLIINRNIKRESDRERLENFFSRVEVVPVTKRIQAIKLDPEDNKFIECADETQADYILTSDAHLLDLEKWENTKILKPKDFWFAYSGGEDESWKEVFRF